MNPSRKIAFRAAYEAGKILLDRLGDVRKIDYKGAANIVTDVDKASEVKILEVIRSEFPDDEILAEESGKNAGSKPTRRWLVDPLDGTTNYAHSYPFFAVSIALIENNEQILGVVFNPVSNELFWAEPGQGAWLNDDRIRVSKISTLDESLLATGFNRDIPKAQRTNMEQFRCLTAASHGVRRDGSAALDLCYIASGRLDGYWERKLAPWDLGAGTLLVKEAGGTVTTLANGPWDVSRSDVIASNGLIHMAFADALKEEELAKTFASALD